MKRTPLLEFESDPAVAHGLRVEEILRTLHDPRPGDDRREDDDAPGGDDARNR